LAAGCSVVIKPPAETPFSALAMAEVSHYEVLPSQLLKIDHLFPVKLATRAGVPAGVINIVTTDKNIKEVGKELCENKTVKKVSFTGSTNVAKMLAAQAAGTLKKYGIYLQFLCCLR